MLPFTVDQFFSVFAVCNKAIWPAQIVAYLLGAGALGAMVAARPWAGRIVAAILAVLWVWNGLAYHFAFFTSINPAAYGFAALLMLAAGSLALWLVAIPFIWARVGATAAILLSVPEDLGLLVSGVLGVILLPSWAARRAHPVDA